MQVKVLWAAGVHASFVMHAHWLVRSTLPLLWLAPVLVAAQGAVAPGVDQRMQDAQRDPKVMEQVLRAGRKAAAFCANCHGEGGNSSKPEVPNLAGQNSQYLLEQVRQFADGRRRNIFMEGLVRALSTDEKVGIALFYGAQEVIPRTPADAALAAKGKTYYNRVCFACHGEDGRGSDKYARIAGQQPLYLATTLRRYRDGSATRMNPVMAANTKQMTDADLQALVAYVSSMK